MSKSESEKERKRERERERERERGRQSKKFFKRFSTTPKDERSFILLHRKS